MPDLPPTLSYYGSLQGVAQLLKHCSLPLFLADQMRDPFLPHQFTEIDFDCQELFENAVKYMTSAILGKSAPKGNPNHPLQKAIRRWRGENRFSDEAEIRESLIGLLPAMVEKSFNHAKEIHQDWQAFIAKKQLLPFFENASDPDLWLLEAERYSGVVVKFKCEENSIFEKCLAVNYSKLPPKTISQKDSIDLMVGEINEIPIDFTKTLLTQNYQFRTQKEWRLVIDKLPKDQPRLEFPLGLIQSVYVGAAVPKLKAEQLEIMVKGLANNIHFYKAKCSDTSYEFIFEKYSGE